MTRRWLQEAIENDYLPAIWALQDTPAGHEAAAELCESIRQSWHDRGFKAITQEQSLMDDTRRTLKDTLGTDHWVLSYIKFSHAETVALNNLKQDRVAERNETTQQIDKPDEIVATAVRLLDSAEWADIAAGLALLTGRRVAEILSTGHFEPKTQWSVIFTGAVKRKDEGKGLLAFEIPTLTTAHKVQSALSRIRFELPDAINMTPREINKKYESAVAAVCDRAFSGLVAPREGKDTLYTHLFRAIYPTIAAFWYCPPTVGETEFKAAIQGHYFLMNEQNPELRRSLAASRHYSDYEISDREIANYNGRRKGIKLGVSGIEPIDQFKEAWRKGMEPKAPREQKIRASYRIWHDDKARLDRILEPFKAAGTQQQDRFHAFLNWFEAQQSLTFPNAEAPEPESTSEKTQATDTALTDATSAEDIPMQAQSVSPSTELDKHEDNGADPSTASPASATTTDSKIDRLIDTMTKFMEMQMALAQNLQTGQTAQANRPAKTARPKTPALSKGSTAPDKTDSTLEQDGEKATHTPRTRAGAEQTADRINEAIDAIMRYNNTPGRRHDEKWAIGINTLKAFVRSQEAIVAAIGGRNRKGEEVTGTRQAEIAQHHQQHQIDDKHNYKHRGKTTIDQVVALD